MASKAAIAKLKKKKRLVEKYREKREELIAKRDYEALSKLPRNSSPTRVRSRCEITGRPRGYIGLFKMSRIALREKALNGEIPGVTKASW